MEIKSISSKIFKTASKTAARTTEHNQTNPFGVSFKGNMVTADVFTNTSSKLAQKASNKGKMVVSAIVGSMNDFSSAMSARLNSVVSFGRRIKENAADLWDKANKYEIHFDFVDSITTRISELNKYGVDNLRKNHSVSELEEMLTSQINLLAAGV